MRLLSSAKTIITIFIFLTSFSVYGIESFVNLEDAIRQVWSQSGQLKGQAELSEVASFDRVRRYIFNEPQFNYNKTDDNTAQTYGLSLTTPFPGKSFALSRVDAAKARSQRLEFNAKRYELAKTATQFYLDCAAAQETYELQKTTTNDLESVFHSLKVLYESGNSTQAEKIGAELFSRQARLDLMTGRDKQETLCRKFANLLNNKRDSDSPLTLKLSDDVASEVIQELGAKTSDQNRSSAAIDVADALSSTAWWSQMPDLTFNVIRNHYLFLPGSPSGREWTTSFGVSVTLPIFFPFQEHTEIRRAQSQSAIDRNVAEIQKISADSDQLDAAREYRRSKNRLRELRERDLPLADALVESTFSAYRAGKLGYAELVLSRRTRTDLRNQDIQLRSSIINAHLRCLTQCNEEILP